MYVYTTINIIFTRISVSIPKNSTHIIVRSHYFYDCIISHISVSIPKYKYKYN